MKFHTLAWPDVDTRMIMAHERVEKYFGYSVNRYRVHMPHGLWMDKVCKDEFESGAEIVCFLEIDCVPVEQEVLMKAYRWVKDKRGILGIAQAANHLDPLHIYAGPAFYMIHREAWKRISYTFGEDNKNDVGQAVTKIAESMAIPVRCLMPTHYLMPPEYDRWRLGNFGYFGRGTHYKHGVFHLFQGRANNAVSTFDDICTKIVNKEFNTNGWFECGSL